MLKNKTFIIILILIFLIGDLIMFFYFFTPNPKEIAKKNKIPHPAIMAHRGLSYYAPEETHPAYLAALELGKGIYLEADIQRTRDNVLICFHDDLLTRTTNIEEVFPDRKNNYIDNFTFDELQKLDAGSWFNKKNPDRARESFKNLKIITLEDLTKIAKQKPNSGLYLETKSAERYPGIEKELILLLYKQGWIDEEDLNTKELEITDELKKIHQVNKQDFKFQFPENHAKVILQSFVPESIELMKKYAPGIPRVLLVDEEMEKKHNGFFKLVDLAKSMDAHIGPSGYQSSPWNNLYIHQKELLVHHYTINKSWQMQLLFIFGSDGIFTDKAELALKLFSSEKSDFISIEGIFKKIGY